MTKETVLCIDRGYFKRIFMRYFPADICISLMMYYLTPETASMKAKGRGTQVWKRCTRKQPYSGVSVCAELVQAWCGVKDPFMLTVSFLRPWVIVSRKVICGNILWHCHFTPWAPGMRLRGRTHRCIKAINKIIGLVISFHTSGQLGHPAVVTIFQQWQVLQDCCIPSSSPVG